MLLHDSTDGGEAEAGTDIRGLGGEERIEGAREDTVIHAGAVVCDGELDAIRAVAGDEAGGEGDGGDVVALCLLGAFEDRIACVDDEVDEDLLKLTGIAGEIREIEVVRSDEPDASV